MKFKLKLIVIACTLLLLCLVLLRPNARQEALVTSPTNSLLQFTSGSHILGFVDDGVIMAAPTHALKVKFIDADKVTPTSETPPTGESKATPLTKVTYANVWNGIDIVYEADSEKGSLMKSTYYVDITKAGVSPDKIKLQYNRPVSLDKDKNLVISYDTGNMTESAPIAWQVIDGKNVPVDVSFAIKGTQEVGFNVTNFKPNVPIVIDPTYAWNTFLGGGGYERAQSIAVDGSGNVYVSGYSGITWGSPVRAYTSGSDAFAAKLDSSGNLTWNTFLGGSGSDEGYSIAVDGSGNVYVGGYSNATWGSPIRAYTSGDDAFAAKLDSSGALTWNTFLGGSGYEYGYAIAIDTSGNVYVGGYSPATWGSPIRAYTSSDDAFAAKLSSSGGLTSNTFLGGSGYERGQAIAVDGSGNVYVGGYSGTASWGSPIRAYTSSSDAFAIKLDSSGALVWNTYLGTSGTDQGSGIAVDGSGNVYVGGKSGDATWGSPVRSYTSNDDAFVAKLSSSGYLSAFGITASAGSGGSISPTGTTVVGSGASQSYTITPDSGYGILDVLVDSVSVGAVASYDFTNVTADHTISVTFGMRPTVTTSAASSVAATAATLNGSITDIGAGNSTQHGFAYGISADLSTVIATTAIGVKAGTGSFTSDIVSLSPSTTYYVRAYATNSAGTGYGSIESFMTAAAPAIVSSAPAPGSQTAVSAPSMSYAELRTIFGDRAVRTPENSGESAPSARPPSFPQIKGIASQGTRSPEILSVQRILNSDPATRVAQSGPGSPGRETSLYGPATRAAVQRFQLKHGIVKSPRDSGYGIVGPKTRAKMNEILGGR